jgi:hypothetical protein
MQMADRQGRDSGSGQKGTHGLLEQFDAVSLGERRVRSEQLQLASKDGDLVLVKQAQDQFLMQEP